MSDGEFDPVVSNKLWMSDGIGVVTNFPFNNANQPTVTAALQNLQSLIVTQVLKIPQSSKIVLAKCQDRTTIVCNDVNTVPDGYYPGDVVNNAGGLACYSLDDPTKIFSTYFTSAIQYAGTSSGGIQNWNTIASSGVNGWPSSPDGSSGMLASRTSSELFVVMTGSNVQYGTRSGSTWNWTNSLFGGNPLSGVGTNAIGKLKFVDIDRINGTIYYQDRSTATLYVSSDGGATLTRPGSTGGSPVFGDVGANIACVHGHANHVFIVQGYNGSHTINPPNSNLSFTNDGGANWHTVIGNYITSVAVGPAAPGATYPTIYIIGRLTGNPTFSFSVYRCIDFDPTTTFTGTWVDVGQNIKKINCDGFQGGIYADPETYGTFYLATDDTGYLKGSLG
jgi:hypothetical protein